MVIMTYHNDGARMSLLFKMFKNLKLCNNLLVLTFLGIYICCTLTFCGYLNVFYFICYQWVNCCCDMVNIVGDTWHGQTFGKIDSLTISANCKLRRIITMKHQPHDTTDDDGMLTMTQTQSISFSMEGTNQK